MNQESEDLEEHNVERVLIKGDAGEIAVRNQRVPSIRRNPPVNPPRSTPSEPRRVRDVLDVGQILRVEKGVGYVEFKV